MKFYLIAVWKWASAIDPCHIKSEDNEKLISRFWLICKLQPSLIWQDNFSDKNNSCYIFFITWIRTFHIVTPQNQSIRKWFCVFCFAFLSKETLINWWAAKCAWLTSFISGESFFIFSEKKRETRKLYHEKQHNQKYQQYMKIQDRCCSSHNLRTEAPPNFVCVCVSYYWCLHLLCPFHHVSARLRHFVSSRHSLCLFHPVNTTFHVK